MKPQISVILPVYNAEKWLTACLVSLAAQTNQEFEIIAIDDGSTDSSADILKHANRNGLPIRILRNESNRGIVCSLNRGLEQAQGKYIARMDADDVALPNRFTHQILFLETTGCDLCGSWFTEFGQGIPRIVHWPHHENAVRAAMLFQNAILHPSVISKREVFEEYQYREEYRLAEDYDLFSRACGKYRLANVPEALLRYRRHPMQASQKKRIEMEQITCRIRAEALRQQGFEPTTEELRIHNLVRAPRSIFEKDDLEAIEQWLLKLYDMQSDPFAKRVIASQWIRACIRAAPLRKDMWKSFRSSPLHQAAGTSRISDADVYILAMMGLDHQARIFNVLRQFGLSI
jgi:glycosyltransferase involved in cell wall biosynthesis